MEDRYITNRNINDLKGKTIKGIYSGTTYKVVGVGRSLIGVTRSDTVATEYFTKRYVKDNFILLGGC